MIAKDIFVDAIRLCRLKAIDLVIFRTRFLCALLGYIDIFHLPSRAPSPPGKREQIKNSIRNIKFSSLSFQLKNK